MGATSSLPYLVGSNSQLERAHAFFKARGELGATDTELMAGLGIRQRSTAAARRKELEVAGLVEKTMERRPSSESSREITVWRAKPGA